MGRKQRKAPPMKKPNTVIELRESDNDGHGPYVTIQGAKDFIHVSHQTLYRKIQTGELTKYRFGGRTLLSKAEILSLVKAV